MTERSWVDACVVEYLKSDDEQSVPANLMEVASSERGFAESVIQRWLQPVYQYDGSPDENRGRLNLLVDLLIDWIRALANTQGETVEQGVAKILAPDASAEQPDAHHLRAREMLGAAAHGDQVLSHLLQEASATTADFRGVAMALLIFFEATVGAAVIGARSIPAAFRALLVSVWLSWDSMKFDIPRAQLVQMYLDGELFPEWPLR